jgi:hypothetical protein
VRLRAEVVAFVGLHLLQDMEERAGVSEVAVMQDETGIADQLMLVDVIDAGGVEERRVALDAVDLVAFFEQQFGEIRAVLPAYACNQRLLQTKCLRGVAA